LQKWRNGSSATLIFNRQQQGSGIKGVGVVFALLATMCGSTFGQDSKGEMYIPILNGTEAPVHITAAFLTGSTPAERVFLKALAAAPKKGTFIRDNLKNQGFLTISYSSPIIDWVSTSSNWPQIETVIILGTITLREHMNYQDVDNQYTFAGWGTTELQPNLKLQGTLAGLNFVDFVPPENLSLGAGHETNMRHPQPPIPTGSATVHGNITMELSGNNLIRWDPGSIDIAFVPDSDLSSYANAIRSAPDRAQLSDAIENASNDSNIQTDAESGLGSRYDSGQTVSCSYTMSVTGIQPNTHGRLYLCSGRAIYAHLRDMSIPNDGISMPRYYDISDKRWGWTRYIVLAPNTDVVASFDDSDTTDAW
jgi:hypothetical protein